MYKKYAIDLSYFNDHVVAALTAHYGEGLTIHYHYGQYLIFSLPAACDKVIRINFTGAKLYPAIGDAWTGTSVITNPKELQVNQYATTVSMTLVLGSSFILFIGDNGSDPFIVLFGKLTNSECFAICSTVSTHPTYLSWRKSMLTDGNLCGFFPMAMGIDATHPDDYLIKIPVMIVNYANKLLINTDGSPATLPGMFFTPAASSIYNSNKICLRTGVHCYTDSARYGNYALPLLVELTP